MEDIHGVDVSWLHHPNKASKDADKRDRKHAPSKSREIIPNAPQPDQLSPQTSRDASTLPSLPIVTPATTIEPTKDTTNAVSSTPSTTSTPKPVPKRPNVLGRTSSDRQNGEGKVGSRRQSWLNNISSKFSSSPGTPDRQSPAPAPLKKQPSNSSLASDISGTTPTSNIAPVSEEAETIQPYVPSKPRDSTSFFSSLTRRLSSASQGGAPGKISGSGGVCARRVLNVDPNRERCLLPEMEPSKLRKVSFCVDVEIAGGPRYKDDEDDTERKRQKKDFKIKERAEGEALKHPEAAKEEKEADGESQPEANGKGIPIPGHVKENMDPQAGSLGSTPPTVGSLDDERNAKKREKKKRSEAERKERQEKRKRRAEENGSIPVELSIDDEDDASIDSPPIPHGFVGSPGSLPPGSLPVGSLSSSTQTTGFGNPPRLDRPTTDPARIYRRCCQLRETPILKRITEQLMAPTCTVPFEPGVVNLLDLTNSRLQLADVVTLGDWLAVVPVKHLKLEDADLSDEGVRCILAGLLAAKRPEPTRRRTPVPRHREVVPAKAYQERAGMVEKLSLKNNSRISRIGFKHIGLFIYQCRSLKAIDLSMNQFPATLPPNVNCSPHKVPQGNTSPTRIQEIDASEMFYKCLSERVGGSRLEELIISECGLTAPQIRKIVDGAVVCGISRLGLAGNHLDEESLEHVIRYLHSGVCQALDIGGNDLRGDKLASIAEALKSTSAATCWGVSLAGCNLDVASMKLLFPALVKLPDLRFIDLSHNRDLCAKDNGTISLFRRHMGQFTALKRLHLADVGMSPKQAIALADALPEGPKLAHLNILENTQLAALASATSASDQEEACALYASLMAAVRVSSTIICIDIDIPSAENSEVVKALAKQVVAYSLRNMEQFAIAEATGIPTANATAKLTDPHGGEKHVKEITVPDVLMHLVGHVDGVSENHDNDEPAPDDDYIVGGTGVVRALQYVLGEKANDMGRNSQPTTPKSGGMIPRERPGSSAGISEEQRGKAKKMSKNLLDSARKIRTRLQPALIKEATLGDELAYRRLLFLDQTLQSMIQRFEEEYPETRLEPPSPKQRASTSLSDPISFTDLSTTTQGTENIVNVSDDEEADEESRLKAIKRHNSDVSLASRALSLEEGRLHRLGQHLRREIVDSPGARSPSENAFPPLPQGPREEELRLKALGERLEAISGEALRDLVENGGWEEILRKIGLNYDDLRKLQEQDPASWELLKESQMKARLNMKAG
ncbi:map-likeous protein 1 [Acrodontium crateriforme]|uniref:Map-likeous protein 1 n=1 Tax=Acrodontium crateriforme TaxID=150365 RepID=A0AAQ3R8Z9_9PEZI|nr:map-likeous protein 1 [Acrodontium crateriforme]